MPSTTILEVANALAAKITGLTLTPSAQGYVFSQADLDQVPAGIVGIPRIARPDPVEAEPQLNSMLWRLNFPVYLYVDNDEPNAAANLLVDFAEQFIKAIDADETLGLDGVGHAGVPRVILGEASQSDPESNRPLLTYEMEVEVPRLVM